MTITEESYYLSQNEVSLAEYKAFVDASGYVTDAEKEGASWIKTDSGWEEKKGVNWRCDTQGNLRPLSEYNHPVTHISLNDACQYSQWLAQKTGLPYRLPTKNEFDYVTDGVMIITDARNIHTDQSQNSFWWNERVNTLPVGLYDLDDRGLYNIDSNIWEWCGGTCETQISPIEHITAEYKPICFISAGTLEEPPSIVITYGNHGISCISLANLRCGTVGFRLAMTK